MRMQDCTVGKMLFILRTLIAISDVFAASLAISLGGAPSRRD